MKKIQTQYQIDDRTGRDYILTHQNDVEDRVHISVHEYGEPISGVLKHWGTPDELVRELNKIIEIIRKFEMCSKSPLNKEKE